ncbi:MAG: hypothetical protein Q7K65_01240 [Candidatus Buchananbacteria bacterium]|nr:hypothetical protein [Candidatus Buchananbacteria bacterium]
MNERFLNHQNGDRFVEREPEIVEEILEDQEADSVDDEFDKYDEEEQEDLSEPALNKEPAKPDYSKPPKLELSDMLNQEGEIIDFSQARSYHELIEMITREGTIKNQLGQELPAETVINLIYKLTYQDLKNYQKEDWTNITLRHKLRETVAKLIYDYKKTDEFRALAGLDLSGAQTIYEIIKLVYQKEKLIDAQGNYVGPDVIAGHIQEGHLHLLPELIRFKIIEINKRESEEHLARVSKKPESEPVKPALNPVKRFFSRFKFWKK